MNELDEKGFVFLDDNSVPFRCAMLDGQPWLFYWNKGQKCWVTYRAVSQSEVMKFPRNLSQAHQEMYFAL